MIAGAIANVQSPFFAFANVRLVPLPSSSEPAFHIDWQITRAIAATRNASGVNYGFATVESLMNFVWNYPVFANLINNGGTDITTYQSLIPETFGNLAFNLGGILESPIKLDEDPESKAAGIAGQAVLMVVYGALMVIASSIYAFAPNQEH